MSKLVQVQEGATVKIFILLLLLVFVSGTFAYQNTSEVHLLESELPKVGQVNLTLNLAENYTAFFKQMNASDFVNLTFVKNITFDSTNTSVLSINYTFGKLTPVSSQARINTSINISSNYSNTSALFGLFFIVNRTTPPTIEINGTYKFNLVTRGYNVTIAEILLPKNDTLLFTLRAKANTTVTFSRCDEWLKCPAAFTFIDNETVMPINYTVPYNTSLGLYTMNFTVVASDGVEENGSINFNVTTSDIILRRFVFKEECFTADGAIKPECIKEYEEYQRLTFQELLDRTFHAVRKNASGAEVIERLVMVGSIDEQLKSLYDGCYQERTTLTLQNSQCNFQRESLLNEKTTFEKLINDKSMEVLEREKILWNQTQEYIMREEARLKDEKKSFYWIVGLALLAIIGGSTWWIIYTKINGETPWGR